MKPTAAKSAIYRPERLYFGPRLASLFIFPASWNPQTPILEVAMPARTVEQRRANVRRSKAKRKRLDEARKEAVQAMIREAGRKAFGRRDKGRVEHADDDD